MATIRDNVVMLKGDMIASVEVIPNSLVVSKGQPFESRIDHIHEAGIVTFLIRAGRKKSKEVANEFIYRSGGRGHMKATYLGVSGVPDALNYTFSVKATLTSGETVQLELAQGSTLARNNHWIGSKQLISGEAAFLNVDGTRIRVQGTSLEDYTGEQFKSVIGAMPVQIQPIASFLGSVFDGAFFSAVNVFTLTEVS